MSFKNVILNHLVVIVHTKGPSKGQLIDSLSGLHWRAKRRFEAKMKPVSPRALCYDTFKRSLEMQISSRRARRRA